MKPFHAVLAVIAIVSALATGCRHRRVISNDCPWPPSGVAAGDTIMRRLMHAVDNGMPLATLEPLADSMAQISRTHPHNPILQARASYWHARCLFKSRRYKAARDTLLQATTRLDSAAYEYDFFKLRSELERTHNDAALRFSTAQENVNFFRSAGDSLSVAHSLLSLGQMYMQCNDSAHALSAFEQAGTIWRDNNMHSHYTKNLINVALASPRTRQNQIWETLSQSAIIQTDTPAYETVLRNLAVNGPREKAIACSSKALRLIGQQPRYRRMAALHQSILASNLAATHPDSALAMATAAYAQYRNEAECIEKSYITSVLASTWEITGNPDSALAYTKALGKAIDNENNHALAISVEAGRHALAEANLTARLTKQRQQGTFLIVLLGVIIIASGALFILYRRHVETEMRERMAKAELLESQSRLARETLLFEEKERILDSIRQQVEEALAAGEISSAEAQRILTTLKVHAAGREERQAFLDIYNHLIPSFSKRIKHDHPTLTEGQIRLAAYIGSGMSNVSIAKLLNITVASVRTNRYRLRMRFNLATDQSLEDYIRRYSAPDN